MCEIETVAGATFKIHKNIAKQIAQWSPEKKATYLNKLTIDGKTVYP